jgi:hypothetical protein
MVAMTLLLAFHPALSARVRKFALVWLLLIVKLNWFALP